MDRRVVERQEPFIEEVAGDDQLPDIFCLLQLLQESHKKISVSDCFRKAVIDAEMQITYNDDLAAGTTGGP